MLLGVRYVRHAYVGRARTLAHTRTLMQAVVADAGSAECLCAEQAGVGRRRGVQLAGRMQRFPSSPLAVCVLLVRHLTRKWMRGGTNTVAPRPAAASMVLFCGMPGKTAARRQIWTARSGSGHACSVCGGLSRYVVPSWGQAGRVRQSCFCYGPLVEIRRSMPRRVLMGAPCVATGYKD